MSIIAFLVEESDLCDNAMPGTGCEKNGGAAPAK